MQALCQRFTIFFIETVYVGLFIVVQQILCLDVDSRRTLSSSFTSITYGKERKKE